jgi:hypothetical protein
VVQTRWPEKGRKEQWLWSISGDAAAAFLKDLVPMMRIAQTKAKAGLVFEFQSLKKRGSDQALKSYYERLRGLNAYKRERFGAQKRSKA